MAVKKKKKKRLIKDLSDKRYILSLDLSFANSGYSIYSLKTRNIVESGTFSTKSSSLHGERLRKIYQTVKGIYKRYPDCHIIKETLLQQAGKFSTIATLQSLAKSHAVIEMYYPIIDDIHPISIKHAVGGHRAAKKEEIRDIINELYGLDIENLDESDSVAVLRTFLIKFNKEIDEDIKDINKKIKSLTTEQAINNNKEKIKELENRKLKI